MGTLFLIAAGLGGGILVLQVILSFFGLEHGGHDLHGGHLPAGTLGHAGAPHGAPPGGPGAAPGSGSGTALSTAQALHLTSLRAMAAGVAFFGVAGLLVRSLGGSTWLALPAALGGGVAAMVGVGALTRALLRLEDDGTIRIANAIGEPATVYLRIPGARSGAGKIQLALQGRTVELQAITAREEIPTGMHVTVVDVVDDGTVEVVVTPSLGEILDA